MNREQLLMVIPKLANGIVAPEVQQRLATEGKGDMDIMMNILDECEKKILQENGIEPEAGFADLKMVGQTYGKDPAVMQAILQLADREEKLLMMMQLAQQTTSHSATMDHAAPTATSMQMGAAPAPQASMPSMPSMTMPVPTAQAPKGMSMSMSAPPVQQQQQQQHHHQQQVPQQHMQMTPEMMQRAMSLLPADVLQKMLNIQQAINTGGPGSLTPEQQQEIQVIQQALQVTALRLMGVDPLAHGAPHKQQ